MLVWDRGLRFIGHGLKNCPNYVRVGCKFANVNVIEFFSAKVKLLELHEVELGET
jgi:hypothetical protein